MDDARRNFLVRTLALSLLASGWSRNALAEILGRAPRPLPEGVSIFRLKGEVTVNGEAATAETMIGPGDHIRTGANSELVAVIGDDAFMLRENSDLELSLGDRARQGLRLLTGALLSVFGERDEDARLEARTPVAAIGIRGTGLYMEAREDRSYICNCYGQIELSASDDPSQRETIVSRHHDDPRWVLREAEDGRRILPAPFINHSDMELIVLESLVGRQVPFGAPGRAYPPGQQNYHY